MPDFNAENILSSLDYQLKFIIYEAKRVCHSFWISSVCFWKKIQNIVCCLSHVESVNFSKSKRIWYKRNLPAMYSNNSNVKTILFEWFNFFNDWICANWRMDHVTKHSALYLKLLSQTWFYSWAWLIHRLIRFSNILKAATRILGLWQCLTRIWNLAVFSCLLTVYLKIV